MDLGELLDLVPKRLEEPNGPFFATGLMAPIAHGEPRFTNEIDLVSCSVSCRVWLPSGSSCLRCR